MRYPGQDALDHQLVGGDADRLELRASRCPTCGRQLYPPRELCPADLTPLAEMAVPPRGRLYELVRIDIAPDPGLPSPYWVCYVDFPGGIRVFGQFDGASGEPGPGAELAYRIDVVRTGPEKVVGPVFYVPPSDREGEQ